MANKGGNFEREICRAISLWWTKGERDDVVWRNKTRRTMRAYNAQRQEGDLGPTDEIAIPLFKVLCIECKSGYSIRRKPGKKSKTTNVPHDVLDLIDGTGDRDKSTIMMFWRQAIEEATMTDRYPLLIFKRDYHSPVVCINHGLVQIFSKHSEIAISRPRVEIYYQGWHLYLFNMANFFELICPDDIIDLAKEKERDDVSSPVYSRKRS